MHITWRHVHRQAGANCTDAKLYFWQIFQFFFYPNGTWTHPPTSKLFWDFWNFFNFAKPLILCPPVCDAPWRGKHAPKYSRLICNAQCILMPGGHHQLTTPYNSTQLSLVFSWWCPRCHGLSVYAVCVQSCQVESWGCCISWVFSVISTSRRDSVAIQRGGGRGSSRIFPWSPRAYVVPTWFSGGGGGSGRIFSPVAKSNFYPTLSNIRG